MKAGHLVKQDRSAAGLTITSSEAGGLVGRIGGGLNRIFGCWHSEMSRPFSSEGQSYKVCLSCGARRQFNPASWETQGGFYYRLPTSQHFRTLNGVVAR